MRAPRVVRLHTVTLPDGTTATRSSETRTYSHALVGRHADAWSAVSWHGTEAHALRGRPGTWWQELRVLPVQVEERTSKPQAETTRLRHALARRFGWFSAELARAVDPARDLYIDHLVAQVVELHRLALKLQALEADEQAVGQ